MTEVVPRFGRAELEDFAAAVFRAMGLAEEDSAVSAEVLVAADALGIPSHGLARLGRYVEGLASGLMDPRAEPVTVMETSSTLVLDARGAMGAPVSARAMRDTIAKARGAGSAFACVRDSNHFGIAGYYARMALAEDMIGVAMTNTAALGVPTFGRQPMFGTNPIAFAAPAGREAPFVLDMSTTAVTRGKIEVHAREGKPVPPGWAADPEGGDALDAGALLAGLQARAGGGLMPLGGGGTLHGGHKGYGLAVMVDILCAVLAGAPFGAAVYDTPTSSARVSHFFGAIRVDAFRDPEAFRADMDNLLRALRDSPVAAGGERVLYAGLPEAERELESGAAGVPLAPGTVESLAAIGARLGVEPPDAGGRAGAGPRRGRSD